MIVGARRTAIGTAGSAFGAVDATGLVAPLLAEAAGLSINPGDDEKPPFEPPLQIDEVILGNCLGPGGNIARVAALAAGLGDQVPGVTVDRQCGSGLEAVAQAAALVRSGARRVLAGGVESASTAPWRYWPPQSPDAAPRRYTRAPFAPAGFPDPSMGAAADALAERMGISRERQDRYAERSHRLAAASVSNGTFEDEILPVAGIFRDQRPRAGMTVHRLSRLRPAFSDSETTAATASTVGTATAGNCCGISDGAALLTVTSEPGDAPGLAVRAVATVGCDPALPGLGAAAAIREVLDRSGIGVAEIGAVELTEAFATVALATIELAGIPTEVVCSDGGAIGYGHPWGASGAVLLVRLFSRMVRTDGPAVGLAACAIGGGLGMAMVVERVGGCQR